MPYYINAGMLKKQIEYFDSYPTLVKQNLSITIIDDCSPVPAVLEPIHGIAETRLYRAKKDIPWNQDFCRNLGVHEAKTEWVLLADIDHLIPAQTLYKLMDSKLNPDIAYRFDRLDMNMQPRHLHPNTWLMTKKLYEKLGGYDERFAGHYGTDGDFRDRLKAIAKIEQLPLPIIRVGREHIPDASTTTYERKKPEDGIAITRIKAARGNARPLTLQTEWERIL